jgi:hypothetical protein
MAASGLAEDLTEMAGGRSDPTFTRASSALVAGAAHGMVLAALAVVPWTMTDILESTAVKDSVEGDYAG